MIRHLIDLWVLKEEGIVIFNKSHPQDPDDQCLGGLLSALYAVTQYEFGETLLEFKTDKHQYYIIKHQGLLFTGRFPRYKTFKEKSILKDLHKIRKKFFTRFSKEELDTWDHDINKFSDFQEDIRPRNEDLGDFIDGLWSRGLGQETVSVSKL